MEKGRKTKTRVKRKKKKKKRKRECVKMLTDEPHLCCCGEKRSR